MPNCSIFSCKNSSKLVDRMNGEVSFHRFPTDPDLQKQWINATGYTNWLPKKHSTICSIHFTEDDYVVTKQFRRLKRTAFPSLHLAQTLPSEEIMIVPKPALTEPIQISMPQKRKFEEIMDQPSPESSDTEKSSQFNYTDTEKSMALKVIRFFEEERKLGTFTIPVDQAIARASAATGLPEEALKKIKDEADKKTDGQQRTSITELCIENKNAQSRKKLLVSEADISGLKEIISTFYETYKEMPTLQKVFNIAKRDLNFPGQKESFRKLLIQKLGCNFKRCIDSHFIITLPGQDSDDVLLRFPQNLIPIGPLVGKATEDIGQNVTTMIPLVTAELNDPNEESDGNCVPIGVVREEIEIEIKREIIEEDESSNSNGGRITFSQY